MRDRPLYTLGFAGIVCTVCALAVSTFAVRLKPRIDANRVLDRQLKVLIAAGVYSTDERPGNTQLRERFESSVTTRLVTLATGEVATPSDDDAALLAITRAAPPNTAGLVRVPSHAYVYIVGDGKSPAVLVLPVEGKGLWSTMRGFLALDAANLSLVRGIEFYEHGETPGLGGEIDNPRWKAKWRDRIAFDEQGTPVLHVARRSVGSPAEYPHGVDALTGATITARGVTSLVQFWLGNEGFGPLLQAMRTEGAQP